MSGNFEVCPVGTLQRLAAVEAERDSMKEILDHIPQVEAELEETSDRLHAVEAERDALLEAAKLVIAWFEAEDDHSKADFYERMGMCREAEAACRAAIAQAGGGNG